MPPDAAIVAEVAQEFTSLLRQGDFETAGARFRADSIRSNAPRASPDGIPTLISGFAAAPGNRAEWFGTRALRDLSIDGPFVTGDQFALFLDMLIIDHASGNASPFSQIAVFTVRDGKICEERYFHD